MQYLHSTVIDSNREPGLRLLNIRLSDATAEAPLGKSKSLSLQDFAMSERIKVERH
jgi:hypothetical protein